MDSITEQKGQKAVNQVLARISHEEFILIIKTTRNWFKNKRLNTILTTLI